MAVRAGKGRALASGRGAACTGARTGWLDCAAATTGETGESGWTGGKLGAGAASGCVRAKFNTGGSISVTKLRVS